MQPQSNQPGRTRSFVFAHLSDPHLTVPRGLSLRELATKRLLGYLAWRRHRRRGRSPEVLDALCRDLCERGADHVVVTGDLTNLGRPEEYEEAAEWLSRLGEAGSVTLVPGNHDRYIAEPWAATVARWRPHMMDDPIDGGESDAIFPFLRRRGPVAFIGLDSAHPTPPLLATGRIGAEQLERLDELLTETAAAGLCRVLLIHHPPTEIVGRRKRLVDAAPLRKLLGARGAELVLHGHAHRFTRSEVPGPEGSIPVLGIPSASQGGPHPTRSAAYLRCTVSPEPGGWHLAVESRARDSASGRFRHEPRFSWEVGLSAHRRPAGRGRA